MSSNWKTPNRFEKDYEKSLRALSKQVGVAIGNNPDPASAVRKLRQISRQSNFIEYCNSLAYKMTSNMQTRINGTWRAAAQSAGRGSDIYRAIFNELKNSESHDAFINQVHENARWIKTFPTEIAEEMNNYILTESLKGRRSSDISDELMYFYDERSKSKINLISRTETSKTQTALTKTRAEKLGLGWYIWRTSEDARVRSSHDHMDGVLINWRDPPRPELLSGEKNPPPAYNAGEIYNCRCYPEPVVDIDFIDFPVKVFYGGRIQMMTRKRFDNIKD